MSGVDVDVPKEGVDASTDATSKKEEISVNDARSEESTSPRAVRTPSAAEATPATDETKAPETHDHEEASSNSAADHEAAKPAPEAAEAKDEPVPPTEDAEKKPLGGEEAPADPIDAATEKPSSPAPTREVEATPQEAASSESVQQEEPVKASEADPPASSTVVAPQDEEAKIDNQPPADKDDKPAEKASTETTPEKNVESTAENATPSDAKVESSSASTDDGEKQKSENKIEAPEAIKPVEEPKEKAEASPEMAAAVPSIAIQVGAEVTVHARLNVGTDTPGVTGRLSADAQKADATSASASASAPPVSPRSGRKREDAVTSLMGLFVPPTTTTPSPAPSPTSTGSSSPAGPPPARPPPQLKKAADPKAITPAGKDEKREVPPSPKIKPGGARPKLEPKQRCKICEQEPLTHVFLPCGHKAACQACATDWLRTLGTCRVCLAPAQGVAPLASAPAASAPTTPTSSPAASPVVQHAASAPNVTTATSAPGAATSSSSPALKPAAAAAAVAAPTAAPASPAGPPSLQKKLGALPKYASLRQRGLATFLLETGQEQQLSQVDTIDLTAPKGDEGKNDHKEVDLAQNFEHFSEDTYNTGVKLFNEKPKKGIEYLLEKHVITRDASAVAQWILSAPELDKVKIGEYIGEPDAFNVDVLRAFAGRLDFKNLDFDIALRQMLTHFRLPGEAQKIDRIMNSFAVRYYLQNKATGIFKSSDAVYVLAFAVIMLNTDLHNPQVKKKMSKEEFLKNNRGINEGENLPSDFLEDLYERIKNDEIKMKSDGGKWAKANKKGWLQMAKNKDSPKRFWFVLTDTTLYWFKKMGDPELGSLPVMYFKLERDKDVKEKDKNKKLTFYLTQAEKGAKNPLRYTFQAPNEREFNSWLTLLQLPTQTLEV